MSKKKQPRLATMSQLAAVLDVDRRQVWAWQARKARNGFPEPATTRPLGLASSGKVRPLYDVSEVLAWHRAYVPSLGGRPKASAAG